MSYITNPFPIPNAEEYRCRLYGYQMGTSLLSISMFRPSTKETKYLTFQHVIHLICPMMWEGANFEIASSLDYLQVIRLRVPIPNDSVITDEQLSMLSYRLYQYEDRGVKIEIIATSVFLSTTPELK
jgi:hypothetical protein